MKKILEQAILHEDLSQVELLLTDYEAKNPADFDIYSYKISHALLTKDYQQAFLLSQAAVQLNPFDIEANYNLMVCAELTAHYSDLFRSLLFIQFLQTNYNISVISDELLEQKMEQLRAIITEQPEIKTQLDRINRDFQLSISDPFKQYSSSLCGKLLQTFDDSTYYIGLANNQYDAYFQPAFISDPIHAKCELFRIDNICDNYSVPQELGNVLLPICLNYDSTKAESNYILDISKSTKDFYMENAKQKFSYLPIDCGANLRTGSPAVFGTPIPLEHKEKNGRKRLVLSIFIDSFNYYLIKEKGLEKLMPKTYKFFSEGVICNQYYAGSEWTLPSIATYWTGKHSGHHMNLMENYRYDFMKHTKVLAEYFHDIGYVTAKIGGNDATTPWQGYMRGIDRSLYQSTQTFRKKEVIADTIQHIETFKNTCQYIWLDLVDLHHIAGSFMRSIQVQSKLPLSDRVIDNDIVTSVKQTFSPNRKNIYIQELQELDFYLNILYDYLSQNYQDDEIIVSLFSDHGTAFMVENDKPFLSDQRVNVPLMIRGGNLPSQICEEVIESADYTAILCKLAGIPYDFSGTDANLPTTFGGTKERDFAFAQSVFVGDPYRAALHGKDIHYYMESQIPVSPSLRINLRNMKSYLTDNDGNLIQNDTLLKECEERVKKEISHLILYPIEE